MILNEHTEEDDIVDRITDLATALRWWAQARPLRALAVVAAVVSLTVVGVVTAGGSSEPRRDRAQHPAESPVDPDASQAAASLHGALRAAVGTGGGLAADAVPVERISSTAEQVGVQVADVIDDDGDGMDDDGFVLVRSDTGQVCVNLSDGVTTDACPLEGTGTAP